MDRGHGPGPWCASAVRAGGMIDGTLSGRRQPHRREPLPPRPGGRDRGRGSPGGVRDPGPGRGDGPLAPPARDRGLPDPTRPAARGTGAPAPAGGRSPGDLGAPEPAWAGGGDRGGAPVRRLRRRDHLHPSPPPLALAPPGPPGAGGAGASRPAGGPGDRAGGPLPGRAGPGPAPGRASRGLMERQRPPFTLEQLRTFLAVAEHQSITRAADGLGLTRGAVTQQVQLLERSLGVRLLERTGRSLRLSSAGRTVATACRAAARSIEAVTEAARLAATGEVGSVHIGASQTVAGSYLSGPLAAFTARRPKVHLQVEVGSTGRIGEEVELGILDVAASRRRCRRARC